ncbi:MAG: hypothetical protein U1E45_02350 [Geminicoccaceae bacterium]
MTKKGSAAIPGRWAASLVGLSLACTSAVFAADPTPLNHGDDLTRPRNQLRLQQEYSRLPEAGGRDPAKWTTTFRGDLQTGIGGGWRIYGRVDLPLVRSEEITSSFNPQGHSRFGAGDLLTEIALVIPPPLPHLGFAFGLRTIWPTAGLNETGKGKYQMGPAAAFRLDLPEISQGTYLLPQAIYLNSVASRQQNSSRTDINQLLFQPTLNISLPQDWFVSFYADNQIEFNFEGDGGTFVPLDIMLGHTFFDRLVVSVDYSRSLYHTQDFEPYQWQIEGRVGYLF